MRVVLVGGGMRPDSERLREAVRMSDCVLAADSGADWLLALGVYPDVLLGDFDSIDASVLEACQKHQNTRWVRHRVDKDQTDMELCVEEAIRLGATAVRIFGAFGTRLDHSLANLSLLLPFLEAGIPAWAEDEKNRIAMMGSLSDVDPVAKGCYRLVVAREEGFKLSLLALPPGVRQVTTKGLLYDMRGRDLPFGSTLAVSNEFMDDEAEISFDRGLAWLVLSRD